MNLNEYNVYISLIHIISYVYLRVSFLLLYARARVWTNHQTQKMCRQAKILPGNVFVSEIKNTIKIK